MEYKHFYLEVDGEMVDASLSFMLMIEEGEKIAAELLSEGKTARIEIYDDDRLIVRRAYPHEQCEEEEWRWKEGMRLVWVND